MSFFAVVTPLFWQLICVADTGQKLLLEDEMEELVEVQNKYERERRTRMMLEEKVRWCISSNIL